MPSKSSGNGLRLAKPGQLAYHASYFLGVITVETATLSSKGQLVIPRKVRELAKLAPGDAFQVQYAKGEIHLRPLVRHTSSTVEEVAGCLARSSGTPLTEAKTMVAIKARLKAEDAATMTAARLVGKTGLLKTAR